MKNLGLTILAEANQPQWRWIFEGAHCDDDTHVLTIWTMYCGIPIVDPLLCEMLRSLAVQDEPVCVFLQNSCEKNVVSCTMCMLSCTLLNYIHAPYVFIKREKFKKDTESICGLSCQMSNAIKR